MATRDELEKKLRQTHQEADLRRRIGADLLEENGVSVQRADDGELLDPDITDKLDDLANRTGNPNARAVGQAIKSAEKDVTEALRDWTLGIGKPSGPP